MRVCAVIPGVSDHAGEVVGLGIARAAVEGGAVDRKLEQAGDDVAIFALLAKGGGDAVVSDRQG